jgi:hypothetical protein
MSPAASTQQPFQHKSGCEDWDAKAIKKWKKSRYNDQSGVRPHAISFSSVTTRRWTLAADAADYIWTHRGPSVFGGDPEAESLVFFKLPYVGSHSTEYVSMEAPNWAGLDLPYYLWANWIRLVLSISTAAYGGLHASAWNSHFPSKAERYIWILSCLFNI